LSSAGDAKDRLRGWAVVPLLVGGLAWSAAAGAAEALPTGQLVTPTAAPGAALQALDPRLDLFPEHRAGQAAALALSPDGATLLVLTSGFNRLADAAGRRAPQYFNEYVFVYDVRAGAPRQRQVLALANSFLGIAWSRDGKSFVVSGGGDDVVHVFRRDGEGGDFAADEPAIALGHKAGLGLGTRPVAAGLALSGDDRRLIVANYQNDSVSLVDLNERRVLHELDLRPGKLDRRQAGVPGGEFPLTVAWAGAKAYVASERDREIVVLAVAQDRLAVSGRIKLAGEPTALLLDKSGARLFVAADNSDSVAVIDTARDRLVREFPVTAPAALLANPRHLKGAGPNGLALSPDERHLFVTLGGLNAVAVVALDAAPAGAHRDEDGDGDDDHDRAPAGPRVVGLIPTGWHPTGVSPSAIGDRLFVINGKSSAGANPGACRDTTVGSLARCFARNRYVWQLEQAGLLSLPMPDGPTLARLSWQVAENDHFAAARRKSKSEALMAFLRRRIKHVVYVVKENRSYDQVLGDLDRGNGDPSLVLFGEALTPNHHRLARQFVTLDDFLDSGETSNNGWIWTTAARSTEFMEKEAPVNSAGRGLAYDSEGINRGINVALPAEKRVLADPDELPGAADVAAPDAANGALGAGYLWDGALKAGISLRNYGFFGDFTIYDARRHDAAPLLREPFAQGVPVYVATKEALAPVSDPYYRGFDMRLPDYSRIREWQRDFAALAAKRALPRLLLVRLPNDHFGNFGEGLDGVGTVETQMADNDYALGLLVETVARSAHARDTLVFVVEDDAQNGADHVDAHRSIAFVAGAYVRRGAVVSERYTTVSMLRTIEALAGILPLGLNDALAEPMSAVFTRRARPWSYAALVPEVLRQTQLPLPERRAEASPRRVCGERPPRDAAYWRERLGDQDYSAEDRLDTERFNAALWRGRRGSEAPSGLDRRNLRRNRAALLAAYRSQRGCGAAPSSGERP
jgi:DNA-binding beta-propeller fold protein YncE